MSGPAVRCAQPGCTGTVVDGYCDVCGTPAGPPSPEALLARAGSAVTGPAVTGSTAAQGSATGRLPTAALGTDRLAAGTSGRTRRLDGTRQQSRAGVLGAGLTSVPPVPATDPAAAVMKDPVVPEEKRTCPACGGPVGRSRAGRVGRLEGFCPHCRAPYSFAPKLGPGDLVAGQYEVAGALAHGGLGWVYLARDRNVSDRWVVLKGLLNSGDPDAYAAAVAERQFLAQVEHPLIVEIYNFVMHAGAGYIVMEYVGGKSLKTILKERQDAHHGTYRPLPLTSALAYLIEIMPAFSFLHGMGLLYCDFKPDNIIQAGESVKLIDLGGVRRADDLDSAIYGTVGYQAPEVPTLGPSVASDIYTVGRTLAVLAFEFRGYQSTWVDSLPPADSVDVLAANESFARLLAKACDKDPDDRFASAEELRDQMLGVLREVVAADPAAPPVAQTSAVSTHFHTPVITTDTLTWEQLPALKPDPADPGTGWLATVTVTDPQDLVRELRAAPVDSVEVRLALARAALQARDWPLARSTLDAILDADPWQWRAVWVGGLGHLAQGNPDAAAGAFNAVYGQLPGEVAPKLALALACEASAPDAALALYRSCLRTDASYAAPSAFGLARLQAARQQLDAAQAALDLVPATSRAYGLARRRQVELLVEHGSGLPDLTRALTQLEGLSLSGEAKAAQRVAIHERILAAVTSGPGPVPGLVPGAPQPGTAPGIPSGGPRGTQRWPQRVPRPAAAASATGPAPAGTAALDEDAARAGLEAALRTLARATQDPAERIRLVERANRVRPLTWR